VQNRSDVPISIDYLSMDAAAPDGYSAVVPVNVSNVQPGSSRTWLIQYTHPGFREGPQGPYEIPNWKHSIHQLDWSPTVHCS